MSIRVPFPADPNPFFLQVVAVGTGPDLAAATETAKTSLRRRATDVRTKFGLPVMHGMFYALTNQIDRFSGPGQKTATTATLTAWYQLDLEQRAMIPTPHRYVAHTGTSVIQEYDVVFCEGY